MRLAKALLPWALFLIALVAATTFGVLWWEGRAEDRAEAELEQQATEFVTALTNFSAGTIDQDAARIKSFAVGRFAEEADAFFGDRAIAAIKEADASSTGDVRSVYVQSFDDDTASVFAVVDETVSNAATDTPKTDIVRMEVTLVKTESGWKVTEVEVLQSPGTVVPGAGSGA